MQEEDKFWNNGDRIYSREDCECTHEHVNLSNEHYDASAKVNYSIDFSGAQNEHSSNERESFDSILNELLVASDKTDEDNSPLNSTCRSSLTTTFPESSENTFEGCSTSDEGSVSFGRRKWSSKQQFSINKLLATARYSPLPLAKRLALDYYIKHNIIAGSESSSQAANSEENTTTSGCGCCFQHNNLDTQNLLLELDNCYRRVCSSTSPLSSQDFNTIVPKPPSPLEAHCQQVDRDNESTLSGEAQRNKVPTRWTQRVHDGRRCWVVSDEEEQQVSFDDDSSTSLFIDQQPLSGNFSQPNSKTYSSEESTGNDRYTRRRRGRRRNEGLFSCNSGFDYSAKEAYRAEQSKKLSAAIKHVHGQTPSSNFNSSHQLEREADHTDGEESSFSLEDEGGGNALVSCPSDSEDFHHIDFRNVTQDSMRALKDIVKVSVPSLSSVQYLPDRMDVRNIFKSSSCPPSASSSLIGSSISYRQRSPRLRLSPVPFKSPPSLSTQIEDGLKVCSTEHFEKHIGNIKGNQVEAQKALFTAWINHYCPNLIEEDLVDELRDGIKLIKLLASLTKDKKLFKHYERLTKHKQSYMNRLILTPHSRPRHLSNVSIAVDYLRQNLNMKIINLNPMDIVSGKSNVVLGLCWSIILNFQPDQNSLRYSEESYASSSLEATADNDSLLSVSIFTPSTSRNSSRNSNNDDLISSKHPIEEVTPVFVDPIDHSVVQESKLVEIEALEVDTSKETSLMVMIWNKLIQAYNASFSLNIVLLVCLAGIVVMPLIHNREACCDELAMDNILTTKFDFQRDKPI